MEIYVQSRGQAQDRDYCWIRITDKGQQQEPPSIPKQVIDLIESDDFSVALARLSDQQVPDQLLLLVTGLESSRRDFQRRIIRNSVAWVGQKSDEPVLRAIAARALQGLLREDIDQAVNGGDGKEGFQVSLHNIQKIQKLAAEDKAKDSPPNTTRFIGPNSEPLKHELAGQLLQYKLPKEKGPLVIVTGIKAQKALEDSGVWRGLSSLVKTESWKEIPEKNASSSSQNTSWASEFFCFLKKTPLRRLVFISVVGLGAVIGVIGVFLFSPQLSFIFPWVSTHGSTICGSPTIAPITESPETGQPVKFTGVYDPKTTSDITLIADGGFRLTDKSKVNLNPQKCTWQFNYNKGFDMAGTRTITVEFKKDENVIKQDKIDITVKEKLGY